MQNISNKLIFGSYDLSKNKQYVKHANNVIYNEFRIIKNNFINNFNRHPVTREIEAGHNAKNISNTLGGRGNLFSFIGFEKFSDPIEPIRQLIQFETRLTKINIKKDGSFNVTAVYPKASDIFAVTPMPWAKGRSWAEGIEKGISGLGYYLYNKSQYSRSGIGIQTNNKISNLKFSTTGYIRDLVRNFEKEIRELNRKTV